MATGGHHNDGKEMRQKIEPSNNGNNFGDRPTGLPWTSLTNNLELNTKSKHIKKKRNKEKGRAVIPAENLSSQLTSTSATKKFTDLCFADGNQPPSTKRNIKAPVNQRSQPSFQRIPSRAVMENENTTQSKEEYSKKQVPDTTAIRERLVHLQDCIAQVNSVLQHLQQSDDPNYKAEVPRLEEMRNMLSQEEHTYKELLCQQILNEADISFDEPDESDSTCSPFTSKPSDSSQRPVHFTEEDKANIQNHLLEKMKTSQEKLIALKQQQSLLLTMRKNAEEKLAAFQAELTKSAMETTPSTRDWQHQPESSADVGDNIPNGEVGWKVEYNSNPIGQVPTQNSQKAIKNGQKKFLDATGDSSTQELTSLHVNLEHIKRRLEVLQEYSDDRNVIEHPSPGELTGGENLGERLVAVEWQRKKLKNRLLELQEKKKASDELMKELSLIKEAANAVESLNDADAAFTLSNIQEPPQLSLHDDNDGGALEAMRETICQLRGMLNTRNTSTQNQDTDALPVNFPSSRQQEAQQDTLTKQNSYRVSPGKRDNIKKGQSDQFPARRHYEAEGRANEDPDVPVVPSPALSPLPDHDEFDKDYLEPTQKKWRKTREKKQLIQAMLDSVKGKVRHIPSSILQAITSIADEDISSGDDDAETVTDNEDSQENDDSSSIVESKGVEVNTTKVKEEPIEAAESMRRSEENERSEASTNIDELHNLEKLKNDRDQLLKLHEKFSRLQHKFSSPKQNNEELRSRGEGGNLQKRKPRAAHADPASNQIPPQQLQQENLLTRQNVATVESQNRNNSSNLSRGCNPPLKKDNINDLSAKYNKPSGHSTMRSGSDLLCRFRTDLKTHDHRDSHKPQFDDIIKQDRNKLQNYSRNRDVQVHSNSSVNSEPLDGSSSALAPDTTVAATWGGSSTQENFEDENEPFESLEEQEEEEESNNDDAMVISNSADISMNESVLGVNPLLTSVPKSYGNDPPYSNSADSSTKRRDNRLHKYFKSTQLNQWTAKKNFARAGCQRIPHSSDNNRDFPAPDDSQCQAEDASQTSAGSLNSANPMPMQDKFIHKLHQQLEKLNALCRPVLHEPLPSSNMTCQAIPSAHTNREGSNFSSFQYPLLNSCRVPQAIPDVMQSYTQQLQLQQQLLLSLSQCYHALYMQQLEIQHLHRCLQQGPDAELSLPQAHAQAPSAEDFTFRPWFLAPWLNSTVPSVPFPPSQISPLSAPPFVQQAQPAFTFNPGAGAVAPPSSVAASAPCALVTSIQPARAVVHPAAQDTRTNSETLNNQVPPRTRANNFLDNFRSYSRQNMLSSTNVIKGKDSTGVSGGPQVRQVHPLVPNESSWGHRSRVFIPPHTENSTTTTTTTTQTADVRSFVRPVSNPEYQGMMSKSKKPNLNKQHISHAVADSLSAAAVSSTCPEIDAPFRALPEESCTERCTKSKTGSAASAVSSTPTQPLPDSIHSEISKLLVQNNCQESYLEELLRELRSLKSDSLQRALGAVRDVANHERTMFSLSSVNRHFENDSHTIQDKHDQSVENRHEGATSTPTVTSSNEAVTAFKVACENACQRNNQNWPPATIIPLGKHIPKPSSGAVKKRPSVSREPVASTSSPLLLPAVSESQTSEQDKMPSSSRPGSLETILENVICEVIPFVQCHMMDDCCTSLRANFCSKTIEALRNHSGLKLSSEFLVQLQQTLMQLTSRYANSKWFECEADMLKSVASALFRELAVYKSMSLRLSLEESSDHSVKNPQPDVLPSSKSLSDAHKQIIPNKEHRDISIDVDNTSSYPVHEYENNVGELYVNMPSEDSNLPAHCNGNAQHEAVRGAIGGSCSPPVSSWQTHTVNAEEDTGYECDPEAEGEPEVEAGTEADLAEADQSPGQQGTSNGVIAAEVWHMSQPCLVQLPHGAPVSVEENACSESTGAVDAAVSLGLSVQASCNSNSTDKEIALDDIPTKLTPMSQEELQRQMADEQEANLLITAHQLESAEDLSLAGNGDTLKDPPTFI